MDKRLVELIADERQMRKRQVRNLLILALAVTLGLGGLVFALKEVGRTAPSGAAVVDTARLPPIRPGPQ